MHARFNPEAYDTSSSLKIPIAEREAVLVCSVSCVLGTAQAKETMSVPVEVG